MKKQKKELKKEVKKAAKKKQKDIKKKIDKELKKSGKDSKTKDKKDSGSSSSGSSLYKYFERSGRKKLKRFGHLRTDMKSSKKATKKSSKKEAKKTVKRAEKAAKKGAAEMKKLHKNSKKTASSAKAATSKKGAAGAGDIMDAVKQVLGAAQRLHEIHSSFKSGSSKGGGSSSSGNNGGEEGGWYHRSGEKTLSNPNPPQPFPVGSEDFLFPIDRDSFDDYLMDYEMPEEFYRRALLDASEDTFSDQENEVGTEINKKSPLSKTLKPFVCGVKANLPIPIRKAFGHQDNNEDVEETSGRRRSLRMDALQSRYSEERFTYTAVPVDRKDMSEISVGSCGLGALCTHNQMEALSHYQGSCAYGAYSGGFFALGECEPQARPDILHCCETYHSEEFTVSATKHYGILAGKWVAVSSKVRRIIAGISKASTTLVDIENHLTQMLMVSKNIQPKLEALSSIPGVGDFYQRAHIAVLTFESIIPELLLPIKSALKEVNTAREKVLESAFRSYGQR
eukprot:TRINITY_DN277_c0_g1_i10.p1 TRINITY_DN277_c0_g1~~TRINITY_DN277_c0_g1_i10.p1  ORF type:complete len:509 (+),score=108.94 TRINITY_DN277_c0_g1_i10:1179-2705(+)